MCRSFLSVWKDENGKEILDGRNNLGVVSINIPRIAIEAEGDIDKFWELLDIRCELAHKALQERMAVLKDLTAEASPALYQQGVFGKRLNQTDKPWDELFKDNRASVSLGYLGIHETVCMLLGIEKVLHNKEAESLGIEICKFLKSKADMWKKAENIGYSLYSTPSEGLCDRFLRLDRIKYGIIPNVTDKDYYQNSFHLDVREGATPFEKILYEAPYHFIATGGHISYCEFDGNIRNNLEALEAVWDFAVEHLNYFGTNVPSNKCFDCGYDGDMKVNNNEDWYCPECGNSDKERLSVVLRITGYLGEVNQRPVNHGKLMEMVRRIKHV